LVLDGTVVRVRLDRSDRHLAAGRASASAATGRRCCSPRATWAGRARRRGGAVLDDLVARGLRTPEFLIVDGAAGLEKALAALWPEVPAQRCTVHKHRNLLAHAPEALHEEVSADYTDMVYAGHAEGDRGAPPRLPAQVAAAVPSGRGQPEEAGERLFAFARLPPSQWKSARTTNAVERLHEEFKRRIKTQTVLPSAETAAMLFWALLASGQITMRKVDGWQSLGQPPSTSTIDLAA
jgi:transposase-like protein